MQLSQANHTTSLPPGWDQHWDSRRNAWYYVNTNTYPPTTTHERPGLSTPVHVSSSALAPAGMLRPVSLAPSNVSGLTLAQQLYANAMNKPTPLKSAESSNAIQTMPIQPQFRSHSIPTPPPENNPPINHYRSRTLPPVLSPPPHTYQPTSVSASNADASSFYHQSLVSNLQKNSQSPNEFSQPRANSFPSPNSSSLHPKATSFDEFGKRRRGHPTSTMEPPPLLRLQAGQISTLTPTSKNPDFVKPKVTPTLSMVVRPPPVSEGVFGSSISTLSPTSLSSQTTGTSIASIGSMSSLPLSSPTQVQAQQTFPHISQQVVSQVPTQFVSPPPQHVSQSQATTPQAPGLTPAQIAMGKTIGKAALKIVGGVVMATTGVPATVVTGVGGAIGSVVMQSINNNKPSQNTQWNPQLPQQQMQQQLVGAQVRPQLANGQLHPQQVIMNQQAMMNQHLQNIQLATDITNNVSSIANNMINTGTPASTSQYGYNESLLMSNGTVQNSAVLTMTDPSIMNGHQTLIDPTTTGQDPLAGLGMDSFWTGGMDAFSSAFEDFGAAEF